MHPIPLATATTHWLLYKIPPDLVLAGCVGFNSFFCVVLVLLAVGV